MSHIGQHIVLRYEDDRVMAPSKAARRAFARILSRESRPLAYRVTDTHAHMLVLGDPAEARQVVRRASIAITRSPILPRAILAPARIRPVRDPWHLGNAFLYVLRQDQRHGVDGDAQHDASNLPDTLGLRVLAPQLPALVRESLPRLRAAALLEILGVRSLAEECGAEVLRDAAAAAFGLEELAGRSAAVVRARRAAVHAARDALGTAGTARALGVSRETVRRLGRGPGVPSHVRAVRLQCGLEAALAARAAEDQTLGLLRESAPPAYGATLQAAAPPA